MNIEITLSKNCYEGFKRLCEVGEASRNFVGLLRHEVELLIAAGYVQFVTGTIKIRITDTGRIALEEYQGAQEAPSKGTGIKLSNPQQLEGLKACFADWYDEDALHKIGLSDYDIGILTLNGLIAWNRHHNGYEITEMGAIVKAEQEAPVVSAAAKIAALEAENAALRGLLGKALGAIAPFAESVAIDTDLMKARDGAGLYIRNSDGDRFVPIETDSDELHVRQIRAIATIATDIRDMLDPPQPYESTPDGSDLLARDAEADDDE